MITVCVTPNESPDEYNTILYFYNGTESLVSNIFEPFLTQEDLQVEIVNPDRSPNDMSWNDLRNRITNDCICNNFVYVHL